MTRGTFFFIDDAGMHASTEFNGDMYPNGYGDDGFKRLAACGTLDEFKDFVRAFNDDYHRYPANDEELFEPTTLNDDQVDAGILDFGDRYFDRYFSDWIFFANRSSREFTCAPRDSQFFKLVPGQTVRLNFGRVPEGVDWLIGKEGR